MVTGQKKAVVTSPFSVNLEETETTEENKGAGLSPAARKLFGFNKSEQDEKTEEGTMPEEKTVADKKEQGHEVTGEPNLTIDMPRLLWDALGHAQLHLVAHDADEVTDQIRVASELWAQLAKDYADAIIWEMVRATADQIRFIVQLCELAETDAPSAEELLGMTSTQASDLINELKEKAGVEDKQEEAPARGRRWGGSRSSGGRGGGYRKSQVDKDEPGTVSEGQAGLLSKLLAERELDEEDTEEMSFNEADARIKELLDTPKPRKARTGGRSGGGFNRRSYTRR